MYLPIMEIRCNGHLLITFLGYGLSGMTKDEQGEFVSHVKECESCQDTVRTELAEPDVLAQLLELRRRIG